MIKNAKEANRPILFWYGSLNLLAVWILGPIVLGSMEILPSGWGNGASIWIGGILRGAPEAVVRALKSLRKAKRWRGMVVYAGRERIGIQRRSKGTNMWVYDLWLAEYQLEEIAPGDQTALAQS